MRWCEAAGTEGDDDMCEKPAFDVNRPTVMTTGFDKTILVLRYLEKTIS